VRRYAYIYLSNTNRAIFAIGGGARAKTLTMSAEEILRRALLVLRLRRATRAAEKVRCRGSVRPGCARTGVSNHWATTTERASRFQPPRSCGSDAESPWLPVMRTKIDGLRTVTHTYQLTTFSRKRKLGRAHTLSRQGGSRAPPPSITPDNLLPKAQSGLVIFDPRRAHRRARQGGNS